MAFFIGGDPHREDPRKIMGEVVEPLDTQAFTPMGLRLGMTKDPNKQTNQTPHFRRFFRLDFPEGKIPYKNLRISAPSDFGATTHNVSQPRPVYRKFLRFTPYHKKTYNLRLLGVISPIFLGP